MHRLALALFGLSLLGCPATNSKPCATDDQCDANQRCRRGACGPICLDDSECGTDQVCRAGACIPRPECAQDTDCASGFSCLADRCQCNGDASCAANQSCTNGTCVTRKPCTSDADCLGTGGRCEVSQGLCLPVCVLPQDCAPTLDPNLAFTLYTCVDGTCTRRCTADIQCGGQGRICQVGHCVLAQCQTIADCSQGQYCTSSTFGRCLDYTECTSTAGCPANYECQRFPATACPPGFDCTKQICQELQRCLVDQDCIGGTPGNITSTGYCEQGHCQPTSACVTSASCATAFECVADLCVPSVCRGHQACLSGQACVDGACLNEPSPGEVALLRLSPQRWAMQVGDTLQLHLVGFKLDGTDFPMTTGAWEVVDTGGAPSAAATVTPAGLVTAVAAAEVVVRGTVTGSGQTPVESHLNIYPAPPSGRRVVVLDAATRLPLQGATVRMCLSAACTSMSEVATDATGVALFGALGAGPAIVTVFSSAVRSDGLPQYEELSVVDTAAADLLLPLRLNPVLSAGGFNATFSFSNVSTSGTYWAGYAAASEDDVPSLGVQQLLGDTFMVAITGLGQKVPVPASVVLYTSPGFGFPLEVKGRAFGLAQGGRRFVSSFAGRGEVNTLLALRSTDFLGYLGAFDFELDTGVGSSPAPYVADATDINNNGLCSNPTRCPSGTEAVPDYGSFSLVNFRPQRQQRLRSEVLVPNLPGTFTSLVVSAVEVDTESGLLPVGFASATLKAPAADGSRPVDPVMLRSGPPYNGVEVSTPGLWAFAGNAQGTATSARLTRGPTLAAQVSLAPFLPAPLGASLTLGARAFNPGQPAWASVYSSGGELARVSVVGTQTRHTMYFAVQSSQTTVPFPAMAGAPGTDPLTESAATLEVVVLDLASSVSIDDFFTLAGPNLLIAAQLLDGYSRFDR